VGNACRADRPCARAAALLSTRGDDGFSPKQLRPDALRGACAAAAILRLRMRGIDHATTSSRLHREHVRHTRARCTPERSWAVGAVGGSVPSGERVCFSTAAARFGIRRQMSKFASPAGHPGGLPSEKSCESWLMLRCAASVGSPRVRIGRAVAPAAEAAAVRCAASGPARARRRHRTRASRAARARRRYTYAQVETPGPKAGWIAGGHRRPSGDTVHGALRGVTNFTAKSLGRVFDEIPVRNAWGPAGGRRPAWLAARAQPGQPPMPHARAHKKPRFRRRSGFRAKYRVVKAPQTRWLQLPRSRAERLDVGSRRRRRRSRAETSSWDSGMVMRDFKSSSLNRTFGEIVFAGAVRVIQ